jgi:hypothetical protein
MVAGGGEEIVVKPQGQVSNLPLHKNSNPTLPTGWALLLNIRMFRKPRILYQVMSTVMERLVSRI